MVQLSPRGYIFICLETIRAPLIKTIGKVLQKQAKSWWNDYIYSFMASVDKDFPRTGLVKDLYKYIDELTCFKIIRDNYRLFKEYIDIKLVKELIDIRHECIHIFTSGKISNRSFADDTLMKLACAMDKIDTEAQKTILSYRNELSTQAVNETPIIAQKETLVRFLKDRVWDKSFKLLDNVTTIDDNELIALKNSMEKSYNYINEELQNSTEVINWFNKHLCSFEGIQMYLRLKSIDFNIPTFEDIRIEFYSLCYGNY
jgi:hypothetical protein